MCASVVDCGLPAELSMQRVTNEKCIFFEDVTNINKHQFSFNLISESDDIHLINQFRACVFVAKPVRIC